jgi:hypothetical protein
MVRMRLLLTLALLALPAFLPVANAAASGADVIDDCTKHGTLTKKYSQKEYKQALADMPADVDEYGDCASIIRNAQAAGAANRSHSGSGNNTSTGAGPTSFNAPPPSGPSTSSSGSRSGKTSTSAGDESGTAVDPGNYKASNPDNVDENAALIDATKNGGGAVKVGKDAIQPGAQSGNFSEGLPAPLIGVLFLLGIGALTAGGLALRRKLRDADAD